MSFFVKATTPPIPRSTAGWYGVLVYAALLVVLLVAQLFTFDEFIPLIQSFDTVFAPVFIAALPAVIVVAELFALPFLLRMRVSPAFRWVSVACGWMTGVLWLGISIIGMTQPDVDSIGLFGAVVAVPAWVGLVGAIMLLCAAAWSVWVLQPANPSRK